MSGGLRNTCPRLNCAYPNRADAAFCSRCGASLIPAPPAVFSYLVDEQRDWRSTEPRVTCAPRAAKRSAAKSGCGGLGFVGFLVFIALSIALAQHVADRVQNSRVAAMFQPLPTTHVVSADPYDFWVDQRRSSCVPSRVQPPRERATRVFDRRD